MTMTNNKKTTKKIVKGTKKTAPDMPCKPIYSIE
jgi:hypothetical protein